MTKIIITIEVEGGNVTVRNGGGQASSNGSKQGGSKPFVERPDPEYPKWDPKCSEHGVDWKLVPAGTSKTAVDDEGNPKRYNAFWACPERGCSVKPEWKPKDWDESAVEDLPF